MIVLTVIPACSLFELNKIYFGKKCEISPSLLFGLNKIYLFFNNKIYFGEKNVKKGRGGNELSR